jgi:photosystem I P700 chlorophyll a apoprotein A2
MIRRLVPLVVAVVFLFDGGPLGAAHWTTPEDFEKAQIAAEAAVARGPRRVGLDDSVAVDIVPEIVDIEGISAAVDGRGSDIATAAIPVDRAMTDLDAKVIGQAIVIDLSSDVLFDFDQSDIKPAAAATLDKVAVIIRTKSTGKVLIEGHTDAKGSEAYNQKLSERRSAAVKSWLVDHHRLNPDRLVTRGWGETRPVAPNTHEDGSDNPAGRARNRRGVITLSTVK